MSRPSAAKGSLVVNHPGQVSSPWLGFAPQAVILWWAALAAPTQYGNRGGVGFACPGSPGGAITWVSEHGVAPTRTASLSQSDPIVGLGGAGARAPMLSARVEFSPTGFTLNVEAATDPWCVHFMALGGPRVYAEIGWVASPSAPGDQPLPLTRAPELLLFASSHDATLGAITPGLSIGFGAAARGGRQAAVGFSSPDGVPPGAVAGAQRTDAAILTVADRRTLGSLAQVSVNASPTAELRWLRVPSRPHSVLFLSISGLPCSVGVGWSPKRGRSSRHRWAGFGPRGLLCFSWGLGSAVEPTDIGRVSLGGAAAGGDSGAIGWDERDVPGPRTVTHVHGSARDLILIADTQTGGQHASARLARWNTAGLRLQWSGARSPRRQFAYVGFGDRRPRLRRGVLRRILRGKGYRHRSASSTGS